jgi:hypothetical protein
LDDTGQDLGGDRSRGGMVRSGWMRPMPVAGFRLLDADLVLDQDAGLADRQRLRCEVNV